MTFHAVQHIDNNTVHISVLAIILQTISDTISLIEKAADQLNDTRGFKIPVSRDASLPARLKTIQATLHKLATELDARERDLSRAQARILELNFMHKLHGQVAASALSAFIVELLNFTFE